MFLLKLSMPLRHEKWVAPIVGWLTGILTGATDVYVLPAVPFLSSMNLSKDELIQALGLSFTVSTLALAISLSFHASYEKEDLLMSVLAVFCHLGLHGRACRLQLERDLTKRL